ncbi:hypothetical protein QFC22_004513 [Naganishia vaughanmartiniae]|uniref:Uncharacterized protein n=1 Tax=Naganishia vaughanmartiniae TaxID=1424756 RepID=A0ACC2WZQ0_9TREE|nr:hypothetical protein QFC22_004513 [Naganishia vaughanmartiniae]
MSELAMKDPHPDTTSESDADEWKPILDPRSDPVMLDAIWLKQYQCIDAYLQQQVKRLHRDLGHLDASGSDTFTMLDSIASGDDVNQAATSSVGGAATILEASLHELLSQISTYAEQNPDLLSVKSATKTEADIPDTNQDGRGQISCSSGAGKDIRQGQKLRVSLTVKQEMFWNLDGRRAKSTVDWVEVIKLYKIIDPPYCSISLLSEDLATPSCWWYWEPRALADRRGVRVSTMDKLF